MRNEIKITTAQRAVTAAGTPEKIKEAPEQTDNKAVSVAIRALETNVGNVYLAFDENRASASTVGYILAPGEVINLNVIDLGFDAFIDLSHVWIDADTSANAICILALTLEDL